MELKNSKPSIQNWREWLTQAPKANWMQSWPYAKASFVRDHRNTQIHEIWDKGALIGFMALQQIKLGPIHFLELKRGPLWLTPEPKINTFNEFAELLQATYPSRLLRRRRWMPEWEKSEESLHLLEQQGFQSTPQTFQTAWLDLNKSPQVLRQNLQQKWRNSLNKAQRSSVEFFGDWKAQNLELFLKYYDHHKKTKGFHGATSAFIREEILTAVPFREALMLWARHENENIAGGYFLIHGNTASYRIGWNTPMGRKLNAHYGILWQALEIFQSRGISAFDLGGLKPTEAQGVTHFKLGIGAQPVALLGVFR